MNPAIALLGDRMGRRVSVSLTDCWVWTGAKFRSGYAHSSPRFGTALVHRIAYILMHGEVPQGFELDHLCRNRLCVNPAHLEPVTRQQNVLRGISGAAMNAVKTHCIRGHEFTPENTLVVVSPKRARCCRKCNCIRAAESNARRKGYSK